MFTCFIKDFIRVYCSNKICFVNHGEIYKTSMFWENVTCPKCLKLKNENHEYNHTKRLNNAFVCYVSFVNLSNDAYDYDRLCKIGHYISLNCVKKKFKGSSNFHRLNVSYNTYDVTCPKCLKLMPLNL